MSRRSFSPEENWELDVDHPWAMAIHNNDMVNLNPQLDLGHPDDLATKTRESILLIKELLDEVGCDESDITNFRVHYVNDGTIDEDAYHKTIRRTVPECPWRRH